jgi:predicted phosphodiesterase
LTRIVFVSDTHVGSSFAVFPEGFRNPEDGTPVTLNRLQKRLLREWERLASEFSPADVVILLGDLIEGPQTRERLGTLKLQNVAHQVDAFIQLFRDTWRWRKLYVVRGTGYHVEVQGVHAEELIARTLGAEKVGSDKFSDYVLNLKIRDKILNCAHHVGFSRVPHLRATPLLRELLLNNGADIIARGHVHYYVEVRVGERIAFTCPSWQLPAPFQLRRGTFGLPTEVGIVVAEIEEGKRPVIEAHLARIDPSRALEVTDR